MNYSCINIFSQAIVHNTSKQLWQLSSFLIDDIGVRTIDPLINWLKNDRYDSVVLNYSFMKKNDNKIEIYCFYDGYEREIRPERIKFETTIDELIKISKKWQDLCKECSFITITEDNDLITITGTKTIYAL